MNLFYFVDTQIDVDNMVAKLNLVQSKEKKNKVVSGTLASYLCNVSKAKCFVLCTMHLTNNSCFSS